MNTMNTASSECRDHARFLDAYLDGELEAAQLLAIEAHVEGCEGCRERVALDRAVRGTLKKHVKATAPGDLRARALAAMVAEKARGDARRDEREAAPPSTAWRTMVPLASAAALALAYGALAHGGKGLASRGDTMQAGLPGDDLLAEIVAEHSRPLPPERTDPKDVRALDQYVGVPVHPATFERAGARFVGGRILPLREQRAAMLQYVVGTGPQEHRVSVFVYDPAKIQVQSAALAPRAVGTAQVQVGRANGYSVAITQRGGVGYAVASDLDADRSAQLAAYADE